MSLSETLIKQHILRLEVQKERDIYKMKYNVLLLEFKNNEKLLKAELEQKNNLMENLYNHNKKLLQENLIEQISKLNEQNRELLEEIKNLKKLNTDTFTNEREKYHHLNTTDIFDAAKKGCLDAIKYWVNLPAYDSKKNTPLHYAVEEGYHDIIEFFCKNNLEFKNIIEFKNFKEATPLLCASKANNSFESIKMLIECGADIECQDEINDRPLHWAANRGNLPLTELLISKGADIEAKAMNGLRPLHIAARYERLPIIITLIENGANINARGEEGKTPLHWAYLTQNHTIIKYLIDHGAEQNIYDFNRKTPKDYLISINYN